MTARCKWILGMTLPVLLAAIPARVACAQVGPEGSQVAMADFLVISYLVFFLIALTAFLVAYKMGMFRDLEDAKYPMLDIVEPDYYTPEWAREESDESIPDSNRQ